MEMIKCSDRLPDENEFGSLRSKPIAFLVEIDRIWMGGNYDLEDKRFVESLTGASWDVSHVVGWIQLPEVKND